ncbi:MAG: hypothetical protein K5745_02555 [Saccharofermentans sp.]|nr:hypothetical protein [Saccharofermentans sp.]
MSDEPQVKRSIFDINSEDRVRSPERLDDYIRVTTPGTWIIAVALTLVLASFVVWGFIGKIPIYHSARSVGMRLGYDPAIADLSNADDFIVEGVLCFVEASEVSSRQLQDKRVNIVFRDGTRVDGTAMLLDTTPEGDDEIASLLEYYSVNSDWVFSVLGEGTYRYPVYVELDEPLDYLYWGETAEAAIIIDEVQPIYFLLGSGD